MEIHRKAEQGTLQLALVGRLDTTTAPELEKVLRDIADIKKLVFDFAELEYLSSAGLRVLLTASKTMKKQGTMVIRHVNEDVMEVFTITGFREILEIEP